MAKGMILQRCIIAGNAVTGICTEKRNMKGICIATVKEVTLAPVSANLTPNSGALVTTNIIMATWSRMMWQGVVSRAIRMLALGPFGSNSVSASATVGGN
ncbi:hypothetical protein KIN20_029463 [Parelaphostrongylus tenuis]|uniref:Uncharacterized protein n=1 Tax=Parelaphostrongylus tenuis TaxID=148309 RepID=A0AAD5WFM9_PARTN|nr:hypothetical protein KIN20_029463 [Parelaphostrongylus tenuis]